MKRSSAVLLLVLSVLSISFAQQKKVGWSLGYYVTWDYSYSPTTIPWGALTHLSYFQVVPNNDGSLGLPDATVARALISNGHSKGKKVIFSIGGGGYGQGFASATTNSNRGKFISNLVSYMKSYGYDGIDTDWEGNEVVSQFVAFHKELRDSLNKITPTPCLTIAAEDWNPLAGQVYMYVDQINDMWYGATASNYPGYLQTFIGMGAPKNKCAPGIGISPDEGSANMGVQACLDLCNMVVNGGYGGIMLWCIQTKGNVPADLAAITPYVPTSADAVLDRRPTNETPSSLSASYNSATRTTLVRYSVPFSYAASNVNFRIFDIKGCLVQTKILGPSAARTGVFEVPFAQTRAAGSYIVKMSAGNSTLASNEIVAR